MNKFFCCLVFIVLSLNVHAQQIRSYSADKLISRAAAGKDTVFVYNFWATWCGPCVKELPAFDTLQAKYAGQAVKVLLVSFDFPDDYQQKITAFKAKKDPKPEIVWFSDTNADEFIPKLDAKWSGALPGTLVIRGKEKIFFEGMITTAKVAAAVENLRAK